MDNIIKYRSNGNTTEIIVKYTGDLIKAVSAIEGTTEILSENFAIVTIPTAQIDNLYRLPETEYLEIPKRLYFMRFSSQRNVCIYDDIVVNNTVLNGEGTLIGIIDSGIDIYNEDFIDDMGNTRIAAVLDLSVDNGIIYTRENLNSAIKNENKISFNDTEGHGTAIAGICAGNGRQSNYTGIAPKAELVIVKLGLGDGYARSTDIMRGLKFIKGIAENENKPVAINLSYGTNDGSHEGNSLLEEYFNEVADNTVCSICVATGNEGASGHHYSGDFNDNMPVRFNVGGNISNMYLSIWKSFLDDIGITLIAPNGEKSGVITSTSRINFSDTVVNVLFSLPSPYSINTEIYINFENPREIQSGIWTLQFVSQSIINGSFDIWLPVSEVVGEETFFLDAEADISLTLPSSAYKVISVGGYNQLTETVVDFTGRGYTRNTGFIKPDIVAPAYNVPAPKAGGGVDLFTGTSFAAPHVTGVCSLIMQWGIVLGNDLFMYGERLKAFLQKGAVRYDNVTYPNRVLGYGKLCFENTMRLIMQSITSVSIQELNNSVNTAFSEDYLEFIVRQESLAFDFKNNENIEYCEIDEDYYVLYIQKDYYYLNKETLNNTLGIRQPYVMGLMQYNEAFEKSGITMVQNQPYLNLRGNGVLVAIIDTGINYRNESFIYEDGTSKIQFLWDQTEINGEGDVCFGREYINQEINNALNDEIEINSYDEVGHGTAMAELAAGTNGAAPLADLIVVKLKSARRDLREEMFIGDNVPAFSSADVMLGVSYAYRKARELKRPLVICLGLGTNQGGHSGQTSIEEYFAKVAKGYGVCFCVPTGNEGIAGHHASVELSADEEYREVEITVGKNEKGINLWIWNFITNSVAVGIISPLGEEISRIQPVTYYEGIFNLPKGGGQVEVKYYLPEDIASDQFTHIRITAPAMGIWTIRLYNNSSTEGAVHLWLPITPFISENTFFINSDTSVTVTTPGTGDTVMVVGGYNSQDNSIYPPTGRGPTRFLATRPYFCAPAVGLDGRSGTSLACAITAGASALMLEWLILRNGIYTANTITVTAQLILGTQRSNEITYPNNIWGYGIMNLYSSFDYF